MKLILASTSPRRKKLLNEMGLDFRAVAPTFDESGLRMSAPAIYVMQLAFQKAMSVKTKMDGAAVLALDTVVVRDGVILGKPKDRAEAERMLTSLRGRSHEVLTGYCILGAHKYVDYARATVTIEDFSSEQMARYLDRNTYLDKAGSYGIQEVEEFTISVYGDRDTVIGLPCKAVLGHLKGEGIEIE